MVMHARKPQRISDGYFEKHQAHPYQKYNSKSERDEYASPDNRYALLRSPNGNVSHGTHSSHGHHHYSHTNDERGYNSSRNSYIQKTSDKERDRDYKSSRNKYTDSVRSPKEKRNKESARTNHERSETEKKSRSSGMNACVSRSSKYENRSTPTGSVPSVGEWSEHISSSGKKYYYNCVTEVSQWEKPREWDSRRTSSKDSTYSRSSREKRSRSRTRREVEKPSKRPNSGSERYWNNSKWEDDSHDRSRPKQSSSRHDGKDGQTLQDMDISPDRSTPVSEKSYGTRETKAPERNNTEKNTVPPIVVLDNSNQPSGSLLAVALPRIVATPGNGAGSPADAAGASGGAGTPHRDAGPPTPTHSENTDPHAPPLHLDAALPRKMECLGSYSTVVGGVVQHAPPMLTPSLVNYVRSDLTAHINGWPADILEKQANKFTEEAYQLGCLQCTRVSAELKCARSLVRHTEIQATLQEQKIMYLRQQISTLEELKSQNSFMSED